MSFFLKNGEKDREEDKGEDKGLSRELQGKRVRSSGTVGGERVRGSFEQTTNSAAVTPRFI